MNDKLYQAVKAARPTIESAARFLSSAGQDADGLYAVLRALDPEDLKACAAAPWVEPSFAERMVENGYRPLPAFGPRDYSESREGAIVSNEGKTITLRVLYTTEPSTLYDGWSVMNAANAAVVHNGVLLRIVASDLDDAILAAWPADSGNEEKTIALRGIMCAECHRPIGRDVAHIDCDAPALGLVSDGHDYRAESVDGAVATVVRAMGLAEEQINAANAWIRSEDAAQLFNEQEDTESGLGAVASHVTAFLSIATERNKP